MPYKFLGGQSWFSVHYIIHPCLANIFLLYNLSLFYFVFFLSGIQQATNTHALSVL